MQTVNSSSSVMSNLSKWVSDKVSPSQQSGDFAGQLAKAQGSTQSRLFGGLSAQSGTQGANSMLNALNLAGKSSPLLNAGSSIVMRTEFTAIGAGIGLGLLASFAGSDGGVPQFGTTNDDKSKDSGAGIPLSEAAPQKLGFGVKPDKDSNSQTTAASAANNQNAAASNAPNTAGNNAESTANANDNAQPTAANNGAAANNGENAPNAAQNQTAQAKIAAANTLIQNAVAKAPAPVPVYGLGQFFDKLFGNSAATTPQNALTNIGNNLNKNNA